MLPDDVIAHALARCRREIRGRNGFPPTLTIADVLDRAGVVSETQVEEAECRAAWDVLLRHADKWIISDVNGGYKEKSYFGQNLEIPKLPNRIKDSLRRCGGWRAIKCMTNQDIPFVQRRFFEEYRAWTAVNQVMSLKALEGVPGFSELVEAKRLPASPLASEPPVRIVKRASACGLAEDSSPCHQDRG